MHLFSNKNRSVSDGVYALESLKRLANIPDLSEIPAAPAMQMRRPDMPAHIGNAMAEYQAMLDAIRVGTANRVVAECPTDPAERARHIKGFAGFSDTAMCGITALDAGSLLDSPVHNDDMDKLSDAMQARNDSSLSSGIELILADLKDSIESRPPSMDTHSHAIVFLCEYPRDPETDEEGCDWVQDAQASRACLRAAETAVVISQYLRVLGHEARAHTGTSCDVNMNRLAVAAGLAVADEKGGITAPWIGNRFGLAVVTTTFEMDTDLPLADLNAQPWNVMSGPGWFFGSHGGKPGYLGADYAKRRFVDGPHPFEKLKRVEDPTTLIDEARVPRVPKRTDMFARALFGDLGPTVQQGARNGFYVRKSAPSHAQRRALGALMLLQDGPSAPEKHPDSHDAAINAARLKATAYFLGADAVGLSRCPDWSWYSHDGAGNAIDPPHDQAISIIIDQGFETMEGASGDDWISVAQSMRAYLRFSLIGGVLAQQIRNLGWKAKAHTVVDGEVLQPPLLLLSGLGEVSRIGEVILNPFLGPRLKSGAVTTDMPITHDKPIDFGLQNFCESCNKCARECPSGAITAGPKKMFNGYEIWKSDSQKCASYRITTEGGAMCGRCMKTCPWNLEGLFAEEPFRQAAMHIPQAAPWLAKLDDTLKKGSLNPVKKWWWDIEMKEDGGYRHAAAPLNARNLQPDLEISADEQTMAVYPAHLAPPPWPFPFPMDREKGIEAFESLLSPGEYKARLARGDTKNLAHEYTVPDDSPVLAVEITRSDAMNADTNLYELKSVDGSPLPAWTAGAHIAVMVAPEFLRQYSLTGDPSDNSRYLIAVLREDEGRGGSSLMHRIFHKGRKIFISKPENHFPVAEDADFSILMGGGIGITPMLAMAWRLHELGRDFSLHYSVRSRDDGAFIAMLEALPFGNRINIHVSNEGSRADLDTIMQQGNGNLHAYTCGSDAYMQAVMTAATDAGLDEDHRHLEYFSAPELPELDNHPFTLRIQETGKEIPVGEYESAAEALLNAGIPVDLKCSDGLCGVCKCRHLSGEISHRDFVLSGKQRETEMILCRSRAENAGDVIEISLDNG